MTREGVTLAFYEWRPSYPQGTLGGKFESWRASNFFENNQTFVVAQLTSKFQMFVQMNRRTEKPCVYCQVINARLKCKSAFCFCIFQYRNCGRVSTRTTSCVLKALLHFFSSKKIDDSRAMFQKWALVLFQAFQRGGRKMKHNLVFGAREFNKLLLINSYF